jgi:hypothetical protein
MAAAWSDLAFEEIKYDESAEFSARRAEQKRRLDEERKREAERRR